MNCGSGAGRLGAPLRPPAVRPAIPPGRVFEAHQTDARAARCKRGDPSELSWLAQQRRRFLTVDQGFWHQHYPPVWAAPTFPRNSAAQTTRVAWAPHLHAATACTRWQLGRCPGAIDPSFEARHDGSLFQGSFVDVVKTLIRDTTLQPAPCRFQGSLHAWHVCERLAPVGRRQTLEGFPIHSRPVGFGEIQPSRAHQPP